MVVLLLVVKMAIWPFRWTSRWLVISMSRHLDTRTARWLYRWTSGRLDV
jgi:hypothetical protein